MNPMNLGYDNSVQWTARARRVTPGGAQTLSKQAQRFPEGAYPSVLRSGRGAVVTDVDGNYFFDWIMALCAITIGYADPDVEHAVHTALFAGGPSFSLPTPDEIELAERLITLIPCAETVRFLKSGSEAGEAAVRIARIATGHDGVVVCGYHGWHSWYMASKEMRPGVPNALAYLVETAEYNDAGSFRWACRRLQERGTRVALILLEPTLVDPPAPGFLEEVRAIAQQYGAVLGFDETITGVRWGLGGAQARYGVIPDLAMFGKGYANGWPLAFVAGRQAVMEGARVVSGTFGGETASLRAAWATLDCLEKQDGVRKIWEAGAHLIAGLRAAIVATGVKARVTGQPPHPILAFEDDAERQIMGLWLEKMAAAGHLIHPGGINVALCHSVDVVGDLVEAARGAFAEVAAAVQAEGPGLARSRRGGGMETAGLERIAKGSMR